MDNYVKKLRNISNNTKLAVSKLESEKENLEKRIAGIDSNYQKWKTLFSAEFSDIADMETQEYELQVSLDLNYSMLRIYTLSHVQFQVKLNISEKTHGNSLEARFVFGLFPIEKGIRDLKFEDNNKFILHTGNLKYDDEKFSFSSFGKGIILKENDYFNLKKSMDNIFREIFVDKLLLKSP